VSMREGVRLALDWGTARIGVAACDRSAILAFPVTTLTAGPTFWEAISRLVDEYEPLEVLVGLPVALSGREELAARSVGEVADELAARLAPLPVRLVDERMSSAAAHRSLASAGRRSRERRSVIDQAAAAAILETALAYEQRTGTPPGRLVEVAAPSSGAAVASPEEPPVPGPTTDVRTPE